MSTPTNIQIQEAMGASQDASPELPSLKNSILKPRNLLIITLISIVLNVILLITALVASGDDTPTRNVGTTTRPVSTSPSITPKPTVKPSRTAEEQINTIKECFENCDVDEILDKSREISLKIEDFKTTAKYSSQIDRNCYGVYLLSDAPDKEYTSYYKQGCTDNYNSKPPANTIQISDNIYVLNDSNNWNLESKTRIGQSKLIRVIDEVKFQQERTLVESPYGAQYKQINSSSKTINDLSQQVTKNVTITINDDLEIVRYSIEIEKVSLETGYFFAFNEENNIQAPY